MSKKKYGEAQVEVSIRDRVGAGLAAIEKKMAGFANGFNAVGGAIGRAGMTATAAFGGLAGALAFPTALAAGLEQTTVAFETMLGSGEKAQVLLEQLRKFAAATPLSFDEITDAAKKLLAFGVAAEDVESELRRVGDIASGIGAPIGEIAEIYGKAKVQGRLFAEDINQLTGRGIPIIQELAKQFGVTDGEIKKMVEDGKVNFDNLQQAFIDLTAEGGKFGGMMAKQSQTLTGLFSTLKDNVLNALIPLGQAVSEMLKPVVAVLTSMIAPVAELIRQNAGFAKILAVVAAGGTALGVGLVMLGGIFIGFGAIVGALTPVVTAFATVLGFVSGPVLLIAAAVGVAVVANTALAGAFVYVAAKAGIIQQAFAGVRAALVQIMNVVKFTFGGIMDALSAGQYMLAARILWAGLKLAFFVGAKSVLQAFEWLWKNAWDITKRFFAQLVTTTFNIFKKIPQLLQAALSGGKSIAEVMGDVLSGDLDLGSIVDRPIGQAKAELEQLRREAAALKAQQDAAQQAAQPGGRQPMQPPAAIGQEMPQQPSGAFGGHDTLADQLAAFNARIAAKKQEVDFGKSMEAAKRERQKPPEPPAARPIEPKFGAMGTSSAAAVVAGALGFNARPMEDTAKNTAMLVRYARRNNGGGGFR